MRKVTKTDFNKFKAAFLDLYNQLGLCEYRITFQQTKLEGGTYAEIYCYEESKSAIVRLTTCVDSVEKMNPVTAGKHEAIHLLHSKLENLRLAADVLFQDEIESVTRKLETLL